VQVAYPFFGPGRNIYLSLALFGDGFGELLHIDMANL
jgi:hypothetical protein